MGGRLLKHILAATLCISFTSPSLANEVPKPPQPGLCMLYLIDMKSLTTRFIYRLNKKLKTLDFGAEEVIELNYALAARIRDGKIPVHVVPGLDEPIKIHRTLEFYVNGLRTKFKKIAIRPDFGLRMMEIDSKGEDFIDKSFLEDWFELASDAWATYEHQKGGKSEDVSLWRSMEKLLKFQRTIDPKVDRGNSNLFVAARVFAYLHAKKALKNPQITSERLGIHVIEQYETDPAFFDVSKTPTLAALQLNRHLQAMIKSDRKNFNLVFVNQQVGHKFLLSFAGRDFEIYDEAELESSAYFARILDMGQFREAYLELGERAVLMGAARKVLAHAKAGNHGHLVEKMEKIASRAEKRYESLFRLIEKRFQK